MTTLRRAFAAAAMCGSLLIPPISSQADESAGAAPHDGIWRVKTEPASGPCEKRMEFDLAVEDGRVSYSGIWPVNASGRIDVAGLVSIRVVRGEETVSAKGLVRGDTASGDWVSPTKNCSGSWIAHKA